jgi:hypothetical protein
MAGRRILTTSQQSPLKTKLVYIIFKNSVCTSNRTPHFTVTNINRIMPFKELNRVTQNSYIQNAVRFSKQLVHTVTIRVQKVKPREQNHTSLMARDSLVHIDFGLENWDSIPGKGGFFFCARIVLIGFVTTASYPMDTSHGPVLYSIISQ